jgi:hypothetical protein
MLCIIYMEVNKVIHLNYGREPNTYIYMCVCLCVHTIQNGCRYLSNLASLEKQMLGDFEHLFKDYGHVSLLLTLTCVHGEVVNWCILSKQQ